MFAHYTATKTRKTIIITRTPTLRYDDDNRVMEIEVEGKADARKRAAFYNATCWNF